MPQATPIDISRSPRRAAPGRRPAVTAGIPVRALVGLVDALIFGVAYVLATEIRLGSGLDLETLPRKVVIVVGLMIAGLALDGTYEFEHIQNGRQVTTRATFGAIVGFSLVAIASYLVPDIKVGRAVVALCEVIALPFLLVWRYRVLRTLREAALRPRAIVLGEGPAASRIAAALASAPFGGMEVVGILTPVGSDAGVEGAEACPPVLGDYARVVEVARAHDVTRAIVVDGQLDRHLPLGDLLALRRDGLTVEEGPAAYESVTGRLLIEKLTPGMFVFANAFDRSPLERNLRRLIAIVAASLLLLLLAPVMALVALAVAVTSPGPILFRQERVGERGAIFELLKVRTMRADAEAKTGPVWAVANDDRVTPVGRFLRRTRLDELPQLWNVLRGDMFFVGPRPERPHFVEMLKKISPHYDYRHAVKPGITGWAQINYRYGSSVDDAIEKLHYDLYYIQNLSAALDLEILIGTVQVMLGAGNRH